MILIIGYNLYMANSNTSMRRCFLILPETADYQPVRETIRRATISAGFRITDPLQASSGANIGDSVVGDIARADYIIADITGAKLHVLYELGIAKAMNKELLLLSQSSEAIIPLLELQDVQYTTYKPTTIGLSHLSSAITDTLRDYKRLPTKARPNFGQRFAAPFVIEWERLERSDADNLCFELLEQMGYRNVKWQTQRNGLDIIAEYPKRDPDGYDYRELWLVSLRGRVSAGAFADAVNDPAYLDYIYQQSNSRKSFEASMPVTFLFIMLDATSSDESKYMRERLERRSGSRVGHNDFRLRLWDRSYLTSLVQQFPQIGFKYFSDEARSQSKYRKTPEELYGENVTLNRQLAKQNKDLEAEKSKRISAERDAIWKGISFTAAHRIGNPIFAIETNLAPLQKRVNENRTQDALEVIKEMSASVEKAKGIVEQFKSLTLSQQITLEPTRLLPLLEAACASVHNQDMQCRVTCENNILVVGDAERLAECFDELVTNSVHWFDKLAKMINIQVTSPAPTPLPDILDSALQYVLIDYTDNGSGVPLDRKNKIFDAFFTMRSQGTGLGLALVRRIIEGHSGMIFENGLPGQGARFQIYLQLAE